MMGSTSQPINDPVSPTRPSPRSLEPEMSQSHIKRYMVWATRQTPPVASYAIGVFIPNGGSDDTRSSPVTVRRSKRIRKAAVSLRCSNRVSSCANDNIRGVNSTPATSRNRNRTTIRFEEGEVIWIRRVDDPRKFCCNVMQIPVPVINKCFRRRISQIVLLDQENRTPHYCEVRKAPKKKHKYCIGGWYEFGRDRRLEAGDEVHFRVRYERLDQIEVSVVRRMVTGQ